MKIKTYLIVTRCLLLFSGGALLSNSLRKESGLGFIISILLIIMGMGNLYYENKY